MLACFSWYEEFNNDKFKNIDHIMNCQQTGADLFHRKVQSKKIEKNFFPKDLLELMEQNPTFYFGSNSWLYDLRFTNFDSSKNKKFK